MPWLNFYFLQTPPKTIPIDIPEWLQYVIVFAPILSFLAAFSNLLLARYIFRFTRQKNDTDRNIKWFQELVYSPHKEALFSFFDNLYEIRNIIPRVADLVEDDKIKFMALVKKERNAVMLGFIDLIKLISPEVYNNIQKSVDELTDELTKVFDNDELKWNIEKTYDREITNRICVYRNKVLAALFNYKG